MYSGEYLVASKTFLDQLRLSAGVGWGRLSSNSNRVISNTGDRDTSTSNLGGTINFDRFFKGNVASFGGV